MFWSKMPRCLLSLLALLASYNTVEAEMRWCPNGVYPTDRSDIYFNATEFNDELLSCMRCQLEARVVLKLQLSDYQCCFGRVVPRGRCPGQDDRKSCSPLTECDGVKHCYDASDEMGCDNCRQSSFTCREHTDGPKCIDKSKICDSVKDCEGGRDEMLCPYYGGWCEGYLCGGKSPKCINSSQVCDGIKDCVDGSDEINCQYCVNQFRCRVYFRPEIDATSAECVGKFRVCDDVPDCLNGADEMNCYRWLEWSPWSACGELTESCTRVRSRLCVSKEGIVVPSTLCYVTDDDTALKENHVDICPECLIPDETTAVVATITPTSAAKPIFQSTTASVGTTSDDFVFPIKMGGILAIAVAAVLVVIAVTFSLLVYYIKRKRKTGRWRPPIKLPRPSRSHLPALTLDRPKKNGKVRPGTHPYPLKAEDQLAAKRNDKRKTSLRSSIGNGIDSGIDEEHSNSVNEPDSPRRTHHAVV